MTLVVVIFVVAVAVGASALWWIHKDGLAAASTAVAVPVDVPAPRSASLPVVPAPRSNNEIRAWGRANGHAVSDRGPLPKALVAAYTAAHEG